MAKVRLPLLVVDGHNVIWGSERYKALIDDITPAERSPYGNDPFERAREALVADVAAYAQGSYEPIIVFDAAGNLNTERPEQSKAGVRLIFSHTGLSADSEIERLVAKARSQERELLLVTSDNTIRATVGGLPVTCVSSALLAQDVEIVRDDVEAAREERSHARMTLGDRLDPETRAKLDKLLGRS
ncbi:MAG: NYN domain-containing protein [Atopobiaceae bacterium]|nr:NYN domain-containing protein [Atopobiaceae bacterium]